MVSNQANRKEKKGERTMRDGLNIPEFVLTNQERRKAEEQEKQARTEDFIYCLPTAIFLIAMAMVLFYYMK